MGRVPEQVQGREQSRLERLAAAQQALASAETRTGMRQRLTGVTTLARGDQELHAPERQSPGHGCLLPGPGAEVSASAGMSPTGMSPISSAVPPELLLPVPQVLRPLLPLRGLRRGSVARVEGSVSVLLALAGAAAAEGAWCAVTAMPDVGLAAAADAGLELERTVVVPRLGPDAATVLGALVDGFDVVVVGASKALSDRDRRSLRSRLRTREAVLLTAMPWPDAQVVLRVGEPTWFGAAVDGAGLLTGGEVTVTAHARGAGSPRSVRVGLQDGMLTTPALPGAPAGAGAPVDARDRWARAG